MQVKLLQAEAYKAVYGDQGRRPKDTEFDHYRRTYVDRHLPQWKNTKPQLAKAIEQYETLMYSEGLLDFDAMMLLGLKMVQEHAWVRTLIKARYPILIVDEYQDLGIALHKLIEALCFGAGIRLLAVGDPDQSIYGFTGAQPHLLEQLAKRVDVEPVKLRTNYRCCPQIVRASEVVLGKADGEYEAISTSDIGSVSFHCFDSGITEQADEICTSLIPEVLARKAGRMLGDVAVLYLDKHDGDVIAQAASAVGYDYIRIDQNSPYKRTPLTRWLEDCARWCSKGWETGEPQLSRITKTWLAFTRQLELPDSDRLRLKRGLVTFLWTHRLPSLSLYQWLNEFNEQCLKHVLHAGCDRNDENEALQQLMQAACPGGRIEKFSVGLLAGQGGARDHLNLITLHSAKGLEFEVVFLMGMDQGRIPWPNVPDTQKAESKRLFFVGLTRAKHEAHITYSGWYSDKGVRKRLGMSEFARAIRNSQIDINDMV